MKKRFLAPYFVFLIPTGTFWFFYIVYQLFSRGFFHGSFITALSWSMCVLCIPLAHGRWIVGWPLKLLTGRTVFPETFMWPIAVALNIVTFVLAPEVYPESVMTYLLYRIMTVPSLWIILVIGAIGSWSRFVIGKKRYAASEAMYTLIRHLFLLVGLAIFFYLVRYDLVAILNALANG